MTVKNLVRRTNLCNLLSVWINLRKSTIKWIIFLLNQSTYNSSIHGFGSQTKSHLTVLRNMVLIREKNYAISTTKMIPKRIYFSLFYFVFFTTKLHGLFQLGLLLDLFQRYVMLLYVFKILLIFMKNIQALIYFCN